MKKKILSTLLAACLFVGIAIPSVMAATSDVAGDAKKVNKITMVDEKSEYEIAIGNKGEDFSKLIAVYEDETKLVLDHNHIRYMLNGNVGSNNTGDFEINGSTVYAKKVGATATLTIFDNYNASSKARVTVKITGVANTTAGYTTYAESFTFDKSSSQLIFTSPYGVSEGSSIKALAHPRGTAFDKTDVDFLAAVEATKVAIATALNIKAGADNAFVGEYAIGEAGVTAANATITIPVIFDGSAFTVPDVNTVKITIVDKATGAVSTLISANLASTDTSAAAIAAKFDAQTVTIGGKAYDATVANNVITLAAPDATTVVPELGAVAFDATSNTLTGVAVGGATVKAATAIKAEVKATVSYDLSKIKLPVAGTVLTLGSDSYTVTTADTTIATLAANIARVMSLTPKTVGSLVLIDELAAHNTVSPAVADITLKGAVLVGSTGTVDTSKITVDYGKDVVDNDTVIFTVDASVLTAAKKAELSKLSNLNYAAVTVSGQKKFTGNWVGANALFSTSTTLGYADAIAATSVRVADTDVVVGKTANPKVTYEPSNANVGKATNFVIRSEKNDGNPYQYAILVKGDNQGNSEIKGINSNGKVRLEAQLNSASGFNYATYAMITVKPTSFNTDKPYTSKISATTVETKVGQVTPLNITGMPAGVTVAWKYNDNGVMDLTNNSKASNAIIAKKVGTTNIVAELSNGETFKVAVTVAAADAKAPETDVPQTGDSFLKF